MKRFFRILDPFFLLIVILFLSTHVGWTQEGNTSVSDEEEVKQLVITFFEGFHQQDSTAIKKVVHEQVIMQSIGKNQVGEVVLSKQDFSGFLTSICSIPDTVQFEERIHDYEVKLDGKMANVWTPYSFYVNGNLSHCGTNSFQLFKRKGVWKIFYIVDTRNREGCSAKRG